MTEAKKLDNGKLMYHAAPNKAITKVVEVMTFGARKYDCYNYLNGDKDFVLRLYDAANRHLNLYFRDQLQDLDEESGLPHLAHAAATILMMLELSLRKNVSVKDIFEGENKNG